MRSPIPYFRLTLWCLVLDLWLPAGAQPAPVLTWVTNSSVKLEQITGDVDWATGSNTISQTITRYKIEGTNISCLERFNKNCSHKKQTNRARLGLSLGPRLGRWP